MMKKIINIFIVLSLTLLISCGDKQTTNNQITQNSESIGDSNNILIAYFSVAENSEVDVISSASVVTINGEPKGIIKAIADDIQLETGADMFSILTSTEYPANADDVIDYAQQEQNENARPTLTSSIENFEDYDIIFIGYPIWWYDMPQVMYSFFDEYDFNGKTIIPFCTHYGSRFSNTIDTIKSLEPNANVIENGFTISQTDVKNAQKDVSNWIKELNL